MKGYLIDPEKQDRDNPDRTDSEIARAVVQLITQP